MKSSTASRMVLALVACSALATVNAKTDPREKTFCKGEDCYQILGMSNKASKKEITKAYRKLSKELHPDKADTGDKERFQKVAMAYEVVGDETERGQYDYALDHPREFPNAFPRRGPGPKIGVLPVIILVILFVSGVQYVMQQSKVSTAIEAQLSNKHRRSELKAKAGKKITSKMSKDQENEILKEFAATAVAEIGMAVDPWATLAGQMCTGFGMFGGADKDTKKEDPPAEAEVADGPKAPLTGKQKREKRAAKKHVAGTGWNDEM